MQQELINKKKKLAVLGLGYVGLPIALEFARNIQVIGFDINEDRLQKKVSIRVANWIRLPLMDVILNLLLQSKN